MAAVPGGEPEGGAGPEVIPALRVGEPAAGAGLAEQNRRQPDHPVKSCGCIDELIRFFVGHRLAQQGVCPLGCLSPAERFDVRVLNGPFGDGRRS